jgi:hypothetical protein
MGRIDLGRLHAFDTGVQRREVVAFGVRTMNCTAVSTVSACVVMLGLLNPAHRNCRR